MTETEYFELAERINRMNSKHLCELIKFEELEVKRLTELEQSIQNNYVTIRMAKHVLKTREIL